MTDPLRALAAKWMQEQADYPLHRIEGEHAAAAVRCCAKELSALLDAQEPKLATECCGVPIPTLGRFCPRCGYEARILLAPAESGGPK